MVWRYRRVRPAGAAATRAGPMRRWRSNSGAEAMVRLADGRFLVFAEGRSDDPGFAGCCCSTAIRPRPAPARSALRYRPPVGYRITDAALLPDGRLLLLNRRFTLLDGLSARLRSPLGCASRARLIEGREIATLKAPLTVDNMEALSVTREGGRTIVWIASDDNFNPLQRTLLLKFELAE